MSPSVPATSTRLRIPREAARKGLSQATVPDGRSRLGGRQKVGGGAAERGSKLSSGKPQSSSRVWAFRFFFPRDALPSVPPASPTPQNRRTTSV